MLLPAALMESLKQTTIAMQIASDIVVSEEGLGKMTAERRQKRLELANQVSLVAATLQKNQPLLDALAEPESET